MKKLIEQGFLASIGFLSLTRERSKEFVDELVKKGEVRRDESKDLIERLLKRGEEEREAISKLVHNEVATVMNELDLVTQKDIQNLANKIDALSKKLQK